MAKLSSKGLPIGTPDERLAALELLCTYHTHDVVAAGDVVKVCEAFGSDFRGYKHKANTGDPKGLHMPLLGRNAVVFVAGMFEVASHLAYFTDTPYETKMGRGSNARSAIEAMRTRLVQEREGVTPGSFPGIPGADTPPLGSSI